MGAVALTGRSHLLRTGCGPAHSRRAPNGVVAATVCFRRPWNSDYTPSAPAQRRPVRGRCSSLTCAGGQV